MRYLLLTLSFLLVSVVPAAAQTSVRLAWDPVTDPELVSYTLLWGTVQGTYNQSLNIPASNTPEVSNPTTIEVPLPVGTYYFVIRSNNRTGLQSGNSNEVRAVVGTSTVTTGRITKTRVPPTP